MIHPTSQVELQVKKTNRPFIRWDWEIHEWEVSLLRERALSSPALQILTYVIIPETLGYFNRKGPEPRDWLQIGPTAIELKLGMARSHACRYLKELESKHIIERVKAASRQSAAVYRVPKITGILVFAKPKNCSIWGQNKQPPCYLPGNTEAATITSQVTLCCTPGNTAEGVPPMKSLAPKNKNKGPKKPEPVAACLEVEQHLRKFGAVEGEGLRASYEILEQEHGAAETLRIFRCVRDGEAGTSSIIGFMRAAGNMKKLLAKYPMPRYARAVKIVLEPKQQCPAETWAKWDRIKNKRKDPNASP